MASDVAAVLSSPIILIYAAEEATFFVHEHVLTSQSQPFRDALTGQWKESTDREIDLQEWDRGTVVRMLEFLYRGSYKFPDLAELAPVSPSARVPAGNVKSPGDAYAEVLLVHAKVYHLAHYKAIDTLRAMALGHVDRTLSKIDPVNSHVALVPFVDFIRYVYANTDHLDNHEEPLRSIVSHFVARNFQALRSSPEIAQLLSEGGDIVMDVMVAVSSGQSLSRPSAASVPRYPTRYLQQLNIVSSRLHSDIPHDHLRELNDTSSDLNWGSGDGHILTWLYPIYNTDPEEAVTGLSVVIGPSTYMSTLMISTGRAIELNYQHAQPKITAVALLRQVEELRDVSCIPPEHGTYNGMTGDINLGRPGGYLYLVWKLEVVA